MKFDKSFLKSKTLYVALLTIIGGFFPAVQELVSKNPEIAMTIVGAIFGLLRIQTKEALVVKEDKKLVQ